MPFLVSTYIINVINSFLMITIIIIMCHTCVNAHTHACDCDLLLCDDDIMTCDVIKSIFNNKTIISYTETTIVV